jgi:hypothetical protein
LAYKKGKAWTLVGIVSGNCPSEDTSRIIRTSAYQPWIQNSLGYRVEILNLNKIIPSYFLQIYTLFQRLKTSQHLIMN